MAHHWPKELLIQHYTVLFWASGAVNYEYVVTNSINSQLIGSRCIPNGTIVEPIWPILQNLSKTLDCPDTMLLRNTIVMQEVVLYEAISYFQDSKYKFDRAQLLSLCVCFSDSTLVCFPTGYETSINFAMIM